MRHRVDHKKLGRTASHRKAMIRNMVTSLFDKERITTTAPKAKEARRYAERLITRAKKGYAAQQEFQALKDAGKTEEAQRMQALALAQWRLAGRFVMKKQVLRKLFETIAPQYIERNGGYTRILQTGIRLGDSARTVMLELVGAEVAVRTKRKKERAEKTGEEAKKAKGGKKAAKGKGKAKAEEAVETEAAVEEAAAEAPEETPKEVAAGEETGSEESPEEEKSPGT